MYQLLTTGYSTIPAPPRKSKTIIIIGRNLFTALLLLLHLCGNRAARPRQKLLSYLAVTFLPDRSRRISCAATDTRLIFIYVRVNVLLILYFCLGSFLHSDESECCASHDDDTADGEEVSSHATGSWEGEAFVVGDINNC